MEFESFYDSSDGLQSLSKLKIPKGELQEATEPRITSTIPNSEFAPLKLFFDKSFKKLASSVKIQNIWFSN